jgi:hypothetical protein
MEFVVSRAYNFPCDDRSGTSTEDAERLLRRPVSEWIYVLSIELSEDLKPDGLFSNLETARVVLFSADRRHCA